MLVLNAEPNNPREDSRLPVMETDRALNLMVSALTTGPDQVKYISHIIPQGPYSHTSYYIS